MLISTNRLKLTNFFVHSALQSCGSLLKEIAEGLYRRYGMIAAVFLAGPLPEADGEISVRRCELE